MIKFGKTKLFHAYANTIYLNSIIQKNLRLYERDLEGMDVAVSGHT